LEARWQNARMSLLNGQRVIGASSGRKTSNALTLTFKDAGGETLAVATQKGSAAVLLGFKNGGSGHYTLKGGDAALELDCAAARSTLCTEAGDLLGWIAKRDDGWGEICDATGELLASVSAQPKESKQEAAWDHTLLAPDATRIGTARWLRTSASFDLLGELVDLSLWWDRAAPLKVPSFGVLLQLEQPVADPLADLLCALCVDMSLGSHSFLTV
jgi:hypothetical protein